MKQNKETPTIAEMSEVVAKYMGLEYISSKDLIRCIGDTSIYKTLCFIYPKGKRPDLGYPVNNKIEEK